MPRRDRIAHLPTPERTAGFAGWPALLDLDAAAGRRGVEDRVRLRFLALRLLHRIIERGEGAVPPASLVEQVEAIARELESLPADDAERVRLARLLRMARQRARRALAAAAADVADAVGTRGHAHAASAFRYAGEALLRGGPDEGAADVRRGARAGRSGSDVRP